MVGLYPNNDGLSIAYRGDVVGVPFNADSALINELNDNSFPESDEIVGTIRMNKETYDWLTTSSEDDDDFYNWLTNPDLDPEKIKAAQEIFEGVDKVPVDMSNCELMYGKPHLLELMDSWGINGDNYNDFRSVIQEHCFNKGLYAFDDIEKTWKSHVQSLKDAAKSIKNGNH